MYNKINKIKKRKAKGPTAYSVLADKLRKNRKEKA